jgi:hypothetical protein
MEGTKRTLQISRGLMIAVLLGVIGIVASPYTQMLTPMYPIYHTDAHEEDWVLYDGFPMLEYWQPLADKIVIEELTTNGTPVVIKLYETHFSNTSVAILQNITHVRDISIVGTRSESSGAAVIRIYRQGNQSAQVNVTIQFWYRYPSTDNLIGVWPSLSMFLVIPLVYSIFKRWGRKPTRRGYTILFLVVISGILITPFLVYNFNGWGSLLRHDAVQSIQTYNLALNVSNPIEEFNVTVEFTDPETFCRITNITTDGVPVAITITSDGSGAELGLTNITASFPSQLQFEFPRETISGYTVQLSRLTQNTTVSLSIETVRDVWAPWYDPVPYYLSAFFGLVIFMSLLVIPQKTELSSITPQS